MLRVLKNLLKFLLATLILISCSSSNFYYQLYEIDSNDLKISQEKVEYENSDVMLTFDFWAQNGKSNIQIYNKTDYDVIIDLEHSHLIVNNLAVPYYEERVHSYSDTKSEEKTENTSKGSAVSSEYMSTSTVEIPATKKIIIPPKSFKMINGLELNNQLNMNCNLIRYPSRREINTQYFQEAHSPYVYRNILTYSLMESVPVTKKVENRFWVSSITNYPINEFIGWRKSIICETEYSSLVFKHHLSRRFYIEYLRTY
ncbi:MAG: hypothetical protein CVV22_09160 [Ignavibacteriae bacterium HGW-Ignavibacteriae-1]|jgi:hypothetical protein|nr:MAG: hypothetical protein CVV22_09160 [Ignavibacteriae bacterium HGW-Ignavibacteriae-1]